MTSEYEGVLITSWVDTTWNDGRAFCAALHAYAPSEIDYSKETSSGPVNALIKAFDVANQVYSVPKLLNALEMQHIKDERCESACEPLNLRSRSLQVCCCHSCDALRRQAPPATREAEASDSS